MTAQEKRKNQPLSTTELYKLSRKKAKLFITQERRADERERLREVAIQKRWWHAVVVICALVNMVFIGIAVYGLMEK